MKKYALIIPVHLKKINWYSAFLHSIDKDKLQDLDFDLIICTSNLVEQAKFMLSLAVIAKERVPYIKTLDIDTYIERTLCDTELLQRYRENTDSCIINVKKFCALHYAVRHYEYVAVADCDIMFKDKESPSKFFARCIENYEKNIYITHSIPHNDLFKKIMMSSGALYPESYQETLKNLTNDWTTYPWFFDIPTYKKEDLAQFFSFMESKSPISFWSGLNWHTFDHIVFIYYRLLYCNCQFKDVTHITLSKRLLEYTDFNSLIKIKYNTGYVPIWINLGSLVNFAALNIADDEVIMFSHTDRI